MNAVALWVGLLGSVFGIITALTGFFLWYGSGVRKRYAAERDFNHLKSYYENMSVAIAKMSDLVDEDFKDLGKELDSRCDRLDAEVREIKAMLAVSLKLGERQ